MQVPFLMSCALIITLSRLLFILIYYFSAVFRVQNYKKTTKCPNLSYKNSTFFGDFKKSPYFCNPITQPNDEKGANTKKRKNNKNRTEQ